MEAARLIPGTSPRLSPAAASFLASIDMRRPWLVPYAGAWTRFLEVGGANGDEAWRAALSQLARELAVRTRAGHAIQFVDADDAGAGAYEAHIAATGRVPTRANLHDFFNALAWLVFPRTKAALNARQATAIARDGVGSRRGPVRDAATLIDESGLLLAARDADVFAALGARQWEALLVERRERWASDAWPIAFGHALLEKLVRPYKSVTAVVVCLPLGKSAALDVAPNLDQMDIAAAAFVDHDDLSTERLLPLPVLGIPGWWTPNEAPSFYADTQVFRPAR